MRASSVRAGRSRLSITVENKILLHLLNYTQVHDWEVPNEVTQAGMEKTLGIRQTHISRAVKRLKDTGLIEERTLHVKGGDRRRKAYFLSKNGVEYAQGINTDLLKRTVAFTDRDGVEHEVTVLEVEKYVPPPAPTPLELFLLMDGGGHISFQRLEERRRAVREGSRLDAPAKGLAPASPRVVRRPKLRRGGKSRVVCMEDAPAVNYFFGREAELDRLRAFLNSNVSRLFVLYGIAGIGKTTLAVRFLEKEASKERHVLWHNVRPWDSPRSIAGELGDFLARIGREELQTYLATRHNLDLADLRSILIESLDDAGALLVFDDAHKAQRSVIQAFDLLLDVISRREGTKVLLITRQIDRFYDRKTVIVQQIVQEMPLKGLDQVSSRRLLAAKGHAADLVPDVYESTGGHPLALELLSSMDHIGGRVDLNTFIEEEVFRGISSQEREVLRLASVFRRPVEARGLLIVQGTDEEALKRMVHRGLVREVRPGRFDIHDLVRDYIYDRIPPRKLLALHEDIAGFYLMRKEDPTSCLEAIYHLIRANKEVEAARLALDGADALRPRAGEFQAVLDLIQPHDVPTQLWLELLLLKGDIAIRMGDLDTAMALYEKNLESALIRGERERVASIYNKLGNVCGLKGDWDRTVQYHLKAAEIFEEIGDLRGLAKAYNNLGVDLQSRNDANAAIEYFHKSIRILEGLKEWRGVSIALDNIGRIFEGQQEYERALTFYKRSLQIAQEAGYESGVARAHAHIGNVCISQKRWDLALNALFNSLKASESIGDTKGRITASVNLGDIYMAQKDYATAIQYYDSATTLLEAYVASTEREGEKDRSPSERVSLTDMVNASIMGLLKERTKERDRLATIYERMGNVYRGMGDHKRAVEFHKRALDIFKRTRSRRDVAKGYLNLGRDFEEISEFGEAITAYIRGMKLLGSMDEHVGVCVSLSNIGHVHERCGRLDSALDNYRKSYQVAKEAGYRLGMARALRDEGTVLRRMGEEERGVKYLREAADILEAQGRHQEAEAVRELAEGAPYAGSGDRQDRPEDLPPEKDRGP